VPNSLLALKRHYNQLCEADETYEVRVVGRKVEVHSFSLVRKVKRSGKWIDTEYTKELFGRFIPINHSISSFLNKISHLLAKDVKEFHISVWFDGSPLGSLPMVAGRYRFMYRPGILNTDEPDAINAFGQIQTWITIPTKETFSQLEATLKPLLQSELKSISTIQVN